jgi:spermidine/putrescine transport system substrate-binding protein
VVQKAQDAGQIRRFYGNDYAQPLAKGDLAASMAWSGDIFLLADPKVKWGIAKAGGILFTDNMLIPTGGSVPTASTYMNFVYDPKIAAQLALGAGYISSVAGVKDEAAKLNADAADNTLVFPTDEMLGQLHQNDPTMFSNPEYEKKWLGVQGK